MMNSRPKRKSKTLRGPFKGMRSGLSKLMESRSFLLAASFLGAMLAWGALVASDGTLMIHRTFTNVPVSVTGEAGLKARGYIVMDDLQALVPGVKMTVDVAQQSYSRVSAMSYNPHFDLSDIKGTGEVTLPVSFSSSLYGNVVSCEPASVTVNVERYMTRRIPVVLDVEGETAEGIYLDSYRIDPTMLSVSGPQSQVLSVTRAVAKLDAASLTGERMNDRTTLAIELQDSGGRVIASDKLEVTNQTILTESVIVDTELVPAKKIPLLYEEFVTGEPAEGYELTDIRVGETELTVAAAQSVLDTLEFLTTDSPMDITGASENVSGSVRIRRAGGVRNTLPTEVSVTAEISEKTVERTLRAIGIEVDGLGGGLTASLSSKSSVVQLTGPYGFVNGLREADVRLFVDAGGLEAGEHVLPVQISIDNAEEFSCALSMPEVSVTIEAK